MQRYEILTENYDILVLDCVVFNENRTMFSQWIENENTNENEYQYMDGKKKER